MHSNWDVSNHAVNRAQERFGMSAGEFKKIVGEIRKNKYVLSEKAHTCPNSRVFVCFWKNKFLDVVVDFKSQRVVTVYPENRPKNILLKELIRARNPKTA